MNLKKNLVDEYKQQGFPTPIREFKERHTKILTETNINFEDLPPLHDVYGLAFEQVEELIKYYGRGFLFHESVENLINIRHKIISIENRKMQKNKEEND